MSQQTLCKFRNHHPLLRILASIGKKVTVFIEENDRKNLVLFGPQESMIRNWRGYNYVAP